ncbi:MAG: hypothetical protein PHV78_03770 [Patescibacteria group bacterium]|nr:hypothetical protein [Patescibacteria group bacterium]MDD5121495.1 hypothetical protein [Patescibacteria group bacterium]MDD5222187.1 hypothetical protein [Patescibacteria group bacterium]MDD5396343.1 hypothetical protein [Patescibacteria group bacterium]
MKTLYSNLLFLFFTIIFVFGILSQFESFVNKWVKRGNQSFGIATEITNLTYITYRWLGVCEMIMGVIGIILNVIIFG